ncbi:MAG: hypothetical protein ABJH82_09785 [Polaribacter sp.]|uniref:hypothetical protein n=1 Tax=Polaribacter sp. TaxID=1920175 RepID=UPI003264013F
MKKKVITKTKKIFSSLLLFSIIIMSSCSSNDDNEVIIEEELSEIVMQDFVDNIQALSVPSTLSNSNNQYAQQANAQFETLKTLSSSFAAFFILPSNAVSAKYVSKTAQKSNLLNSTKTYTWSSNGIMVEYTITEASDKYSFSYSVSSVDFTGKFMDGNQLKDGSYAVVNIYSEDNTLSSTIKWWLNADVTKIELMSDDYTIVLESNGTDNSGSLKVYESSFLAALYTWNSNGTGSYIDYYSNETYTW